jgi:hypothetical protein
MAEPLKATFFALKPRDRMVLLPATLLYAVVVVLIVAAFTALNWGALQSIFALIRDMPSEQLGESQAMNLFSGMMGMFGWLFLLLFPFYFATAAYEAACLRWMIRGEAPGLFGLTFDHDMWRVYGVYWVWFLAQWVVSFIASIVMMPFMFMMMGDVVAQGGADPNSQAMWDLQLKMQSLSLIQYIPLVFIGIRFGPAAAASIARRRFSFFEAWRVTRDRFWALFGSYLVLWLALALVYVVVGAAIYAPLFGSLIRDMIAAWPALPDDVGQRYVEILSRPSSWPLIGAGYLSGLVVMLAYMVFSYGINARAALVALDEGKIERAAPS